MSKNWLVTLTKADYLIKDQYLTTTEKLPKLVEDLQARFAIWDPDADSIRIAPTELVYV